MMPLKVWKYPKFGLVMFIVFFGWCDFEVVTLYMTFLYAWYQAYLTSDFKMCAACRRCYAPYILSPTQSLAPLQPWSLAE